MKRYVPFLLFVLLASACAVAEPAPTGGSSPAPTQSPAPSAVASPTSQPSGSCIFTLDVDNQTALEVRVAANGTLLGNVAAHDTQRFYEFTNGYPSMPWSVQVTRTSDDAVLASKDFPEGTLSGTVTVRDEPEAFAAGYCP